MRLEYDKQTTVLPMRFFGTDYDFEFDASDMLTNSRILDMMHRYEEYRNKGMTRDKGETTEEQIANLRNYVDEGIELCHSLNDTMSEIVDGWNEVYTRTPLNLGFWGDVLTAMMRLISTAKTERKVAEQMEGER